MRLASWAGMIPCRANMFKWARLPSQIVRQEAIIKRDGIGENYPPKDRWPPRNARPRVYPSLSFFLMLKVSYNYLGSISYLHSFQESPGSEVGEGIGESRFLSLNFN